MKKNLGLILGVAVLAVLIAVAAVLYNRLVDKYKPNQLITETTAVTEGGTKGESDAYMAPDFTVYDREGNAVKLSDFKGKPVVINFWASWCPYCIQEMPEFNKKYEEIGDSVQFMMINCTGGRETFETATEFMDSTDYIFPVFYDTDIDAAAKYGASSLPVTFFVNAKGEFTTYAQGRIDMATLEKGISMITE